MFKNTVKQKFSTRNLNPKNRILFSKSARTLANQLLVLKSVNDHIAGRNDESGETIIRSSFGQTMKSR